MTSPTLLAPLSAASTASPPHPVVAAFLDALTCQEFDRLAACFHPTVRARLLTPSALAMPRDAAGVADKFRQWFGACDVFTVEQAEAGVIGDASACHSIRYRLHLREHGAWYACEQQVYGWVRDGLVERIDLLCSGFQPAKAPAEG